MQHLNKRDRNITYSLLLGKVFPKSHRHILTLLARVTALLYSYSLEIGTPHILQKQFIIIHHLRRQPACSDMWQFFGQCHLTSLLTVIVATETTPLVIEQKRHTRKPVYEMRHCNCKHIIKRFYHSKVRAIGSFLKPHKLLYPVSLTVYTTHHASHLDHIGVAEIGLYAYR